MVTIYDLQHKVITMTTPLPLGDTVVRTMQDGTMVFVMTSSGSTYATLMFVVLGLVLVAVVLTLLLTSFLYSYLPSYLFVPSFLPSFLPIFLSSFLPFYLFCRKFILSFPIYSTSSSSPFTPDLPSSLPLFPGSLFRFVEKNTTEKLEVKSVNFAPIMYLILFFYNILQFFFIQKFIYFVILFLIYNFNKYYLSNFF